MFCLQVAKCSALAQPLVRLLAAEAAQQQCSTEPQQGNDAARGHNTRSSGPRDAVPPVPPLRVHVRTEVAAPATHSVDNLPSIDPAAAAAGSNAGQRTPDAQNQQEDGMRSALQHTPAPVADVRESALQAMEASIFGTSAAQVRFDSFVLQ